MLVPSLALGQAIGRWGNFFNSEAFGVPTDLLEIVHSLCGTPVIYADAQFFINVSVRVNLNFALFLLLIALFRRGMQGKMTLPPALSVACTSSVQPGSHLDRRVEDRSALPGCPSTNLRWSKNCPLMSAARDACRDRLIWLYRRLQNSEPTGPLSSPVRFAGAGQCARPHPGAAERLMSRSRSGQTH